MSTVRRAIVASALALPLTLGTAGVASADASYGEDQAYAGAGGAGTHSVDSYADAYGGVYYLESSTYAGPEGAAVDVTGASADVDDSGYVHEWSGATAEGAWSDDAHASADGIIHELFPVDTDEDVDVEADEEHDDD